MKNRVALTFLAAALILFGCTSLHNIPVSELEPGQKIVINEPGSKLKGTIENVDEEIAVVSDESGNVRQQTELDLNDDETEILVRKFSWLKTIALIGVSPVAIAIVLAILFAVLDPPLNT